LFDGGALVACARDAFLFRQGDPVRFMYLVVEGQIDLERHARSGAPMTLQRASAGRVVAEASAYSAAYHCDGIATEETRARAIPVAEFRCRLDGDPNLAGAWAAGHPPPQLLHGNNENIYNGALFTLLAQAKNKCVLDNRV
ncbi:MAG: cyclic nucleotide-binding domain-containing protein, partial [Rhodospirillaceae bacterium]